MAPTKGSKHWSGNNPSGIGQALHTKRMWLVRSGKASWVPPRLYSPEEAWARAMQ